MRGGLDDALDKLARLDELRRRTAGESPGQPPAISELVEAIAGVVARHPELGVTVGAEGAGDPVLLHFFFAEGQVQVAADTPPAIEEESAPRHADFEIDLEEPTEATHRPASPTTAPPGGETRRIVREDAGAAPYGYAEGPTVARTYYAGAAPAERHYSSYDDVAEHRYPAHDAGETSRDLGARMRNLGMASRTQGPAGPTPPPSTPPPSGPPSGQTPGGYPPHPFAATPPPPVPPQRPAPRPAPEAVHRSTIPVPPPRPPAAEQTTRRIHAEQHRAPAEPSAAERIAPQQRGASMPTPLPRPIPLQVERPEETELAARRLAAMLRSDPSLLNQAPQAD